MAETLRVLAYDAHDEVLKDVLIEDAEEAPEFYAHQLLHVEGVEAVNVFSASGATLLVVREETD